MPAIRSYEDRMTLANAQAYEARFDAGSVERQRDLIERAKRNPEDFGRLFQRYSPMLLNHVYRRTGDVHATEDLVADVFLSAMRAFPGFRYRGIGLHAWFLRIATNTVNRWARRKRRWTFAVLQVDPVDDPRDSSMRDSAGDERLQRALLALPPRFQAVLSLHHMEGLSVKETAQIIGCREGTVRSRLSRARDALREKLSERR